MRSSTNPSAVNTAFRRIRLWFNLEMKEEFIMAVNRDGKRIGQITVSQKRRDGV